MPEASERRVERILTSINNWRLGSRRMEREHFLATVQLLIERLEEVVEEEDGFEWADDE